MFQLLDVADRSCEFTGDLRILDSHADILFRSQAATLMEEYAWDEDWIALLQQLLDLRTLHFPQAQEAPSETAQRRAFDCFTGLGDDSALGKAFMSPNGPLAPFHKLTSPVAPARLHGSSPQLAHDGFVSVVTSFNGSFAHVHVPTAFVSPVQHNGSVMQLADFSHISPTISVNVTSASPSMPTAPMKATRHNDFAYQIGRKGYFPGMTPHNGLSAHGYMPTAPGTFIRAHTHALQAARNDYAPATGLSNVASVPLCISTAASVVKRHNQPTYQLAQDGNCSVLILPNGTMAAARLPVASWTSVHHNQSASQLASDCYFSQSRLNPLATTVNAAPRSKQYNNIDAGSHTIYCNFPESHQAPTFVSSLSGGAPKNIFCAPDIPNLVYTDFLAPALNFISCAANTQIGNTTSIPPYSTDPSNKGFYVNGKSPQKERKPRERTTSLHLPVSLRKPLGERKILKKRSYRRCKY